MRRLFQFKTNCEASASTKLLRRNHMFQFTNSRGLLRNNHSANFLVISYASSIGKCFRFCHGPSCQNHNCRGFAEKTSSKYLSFYSSFQILHDCHFSMQLEKLLSADVVQFKSQFFGLVFYNARATSWSGLALKSNSGTLTRLFSSNKNYFAQFST